LITLISRKSSFCNGADRRPIQISSLSRLTCSVCARSFAKSRSRQTLSVTAIPMCAPCHKTFLKSSSSGAVRSPSYDKSLKVKNGLHSSATPSGPALSTIPTTSKTHSIPYLAAPVGTARLSSDADARCVSSDSFLDRIIDGLAKTKHFNERGEYILPQFVPALITRKVSFIVFTVALRSCNGDFILRARCRLCGGNLTISLPTVIP
jgi:hypothetical protein